ncbi:hypothetical protein ACFE04_027122 [Oxalis oulophora]
MASNEYTWCTLHDGLLKSGDFEKSLTLWKDIHAQGFAQNTTMINGLCKLGKMSEAEDNFNRMKELGCLLDEITYRTLIDGYCKVGNVEEAFKVQNFMKKQLIFPVTYGALIAGWCDQGMLDRAFSVYFEMIKKVLLQIIYGDL